MKNKIKITLIKSMISQPKKHRKIIKSLKLNKINQTKIFNVTPSIEGMAFKVKHLITTEIYNYETK